VRDDQGRGRESFRGVKAEEKENGEKSHRELGGNKTFGPDVCEVRGHKGKDQQRGDWGPLAGGKNSTNFNCKKKKENVGTYVSTTKSFVKSSR